MKRYIRLTAIFLMLCLTVGVFASCDSDEDDDTGGGGYRSSYWYDSPSVQRDKANDIRDKYWDVDEDGQWHKKE